jgi:phosphoserine aminotransferase
MPQIHLPNSIRPKDGRFGCGPSRTRPEQLANFQIFAKKYLGTSHRQAPIRDMVQEIKTGLLDLFKAPAGYEVILGNGGASAFWDVATFSLAEKKAQALVHGDFGSKLAKILAAPWLSKPTVIEAEPGSRFNLVAEPGVDIYAYPHNETSTGVVCDVLRVRGADDDALMLTDATSAAGGIDFDLSQTDVYYFSPQKNFSSDGGLWLAMVSPRAIERIERVAASGRYIPNILSLKLALDNARENYTLNTPALATLFFLNDQIQWILDNGGLSWADQKTKLNSKVMFDWAEKNPLAEAFVKNPAHRSQVVATINFADQIDAMGIAQILRENDIVDTDPYRKLGRNQLRVATFVATEMADLEALTACIDFILERL